MSKHADLEERGEGPSLRPPLAASPLTTSVSPCRCGEKREPAARLGRSPLSGPGTPSLSTSCRARARARNRLPRPPRDRGVSHTWHVRGGHHVGEGWVPRWPCGHTPTKGTSSAQGPRTPQHPGPRGTEDVAPSRWKEQGGLAPPGGALEAGAAARNSRPRTPLPRQRMRSVAVSWKLHPADAPRGSVKILNLLGGKWKKPDRAVQPGQGARQGADAISRPRLARDR